MQPCQDQTQCQKPSVPGVYQQQERTYYFSYANAILFNVTATNPKMQLQIFKNPCTFFFVPADFFSYFIATYEIFHSRRSLILVTKKRWKCSFQICKVWASSLVHFVLERLRLIKSPVSSFKVFIIPDIFVLQSLI